MIDDNEINCKAGMINFSCKGFLTQHFLLKYPIHKIETLDVYRPKFFCEMTARIDPSNAIEISSDLLFFSEMSFRTTLYCLAVQLILVLFLWRCNNNTTN